MKKYLLIYKKLTLNTILGFGLNLTIFFHTMLKSCGKTLIYVAVKLFRSINFKKNPLRCLKITKKFSTFTSFMCVEMWKTGGISLVNYT